MNCYHTLNVIGLTFLNSGIFNAKTIVTRKCNRHYFLIIILFIASDSEIAIIVDVAQGDAIHANLEILISFLRVENVANPSRHVEWCVIVTLNK